MGTVLLACCKAATLALVEAMMTSSVRATTAIIDPDVAAGAPSELLQALEETGEACLPVRLVRSRVHEHTDASHLVALLRPSHKRPSSRHTAEKRDELASLHSLSQGQEAALYRFKRVL
jgi:hypothetical protein